MKIKFFAVVLILAAVVFGSAGIVRAADQPTISVTSPASGVKVTAGKNFDITWTSKAVNTVYIHMATYDEKGSLMGLFFLNGPVPAGKGKYSWSIPNSYSTLPNNNRVKIIISSTASITLPVNDKSDGYFSLSVATPANLLWDADGSGISDTATDGNIISKYLFNSTSFQVNDLLGSSASRKNSADVKKYLDCLSRKNLLDVDGNGKNDALTDGILISRYLTGLTGKVLTTGAVGKNATRKSDDDIYKFLSTATDYNACGSGLAQPSILIVSPNGGEQWKPRETHNITWTSSGIQKVTIILNAVNGIRQTLVTDVPAEKGTYSWKIPDDISSGSAYWILINSGNLSAYGGYFTISQTTSTQTNNSANSANSSTMSVPVTGSTSFPSVTPACHSDNKKPLVFAGLAPEGNLKLKNDWQGRRNTIISYLDKMSCNINGVEGETKDMAYDSQLIGKAHDKGYLAMVDITGRSDGDTVTYSNSFSRAMEAVKNGADYIVFDEFFPKESPNFTGKLFNSFKDKIKAINSKAQVGIVEPTLEEYQAYAATGAKPDFIGSEQYLDSQGVMDYLKNDGALQASSPTDIITKAKPLFPGAKLHVWIDSADEIKTFYNQCDVLILFTVDRDRIAPTYKDPGLTASFNLEDIETALKANVPQSKNYNFLNSTGNGAASFIGGIERFFSYIFNNHHAK